MEATCDQSGPRPRVIEVEIQGLDLSVCTSAFQSDVAHLDGLGCLGGSGLALGMLTSAAGDSPCLGIAVGNAVHRGLASSGRISIAGISPLTGRLAEAALGGDMARCLATLGDGLLLRGTSPGAGKQASLLVLERIEGEVVGRLVGLDLSGATVDEACREIVAREQAQAPELPMALLTIGLAGLAGSPMAMIRTGTSHVSSAGRGGLGALLGAMGLGGIAIRSASSPGQKDPGQNMPSGFRSSPRLMERSKSGTLELFGAFAARGELSGRNYSEFLAPEAGARLGQEAQDLQRDRHGCKGCSTPCGLVFERGDGAKSGARFSAAWALGPNLGLETFAESLELLALCDEAGIDAREAGACLALLALAQEREVEVPEWAPRTAAFGDLEGLKSALRELPPMGSGELAKALGLEDDHFAAQGGAARPEGNFASTLGQLVSTGGNDPMRVFPFLVASPGEGGALPDGTLLPEGALDPKSPKGKGRVVAWHEDLAASLDIAGFCCFSTAGLLADGVATLDEIGAWIAPENLDRGGLGRPWSGVGSPGAKLLAAGRALVIARRLFNEQLDPNRAMEEVPTWARDDLAMAGMFDEYQRVRGLDASGRVAAGQAAWLGSDGTGEPASAWDQATVQLGMEEALGEDSKTPKGSTPSPDQEPSAKAARLADTKGVVQITGGGSLGLAFSEGEVSLVIHGAQPLSEVLAALGRAVPDASKLLHGPGGILPTVWRNGQRLAPDAMVQPGDRLNLVLVLAGG